MKDGMDMTLLGHILNTSNDNKGILLMRILSMCSSCMAQIMPVHATLSSVSRIEGS